MSEAKSRTAVRDKKLLWWGVKDVWDPTREDFGLPTLLGNMLECRTITRHLDETHFNYEPHIPDKRYGDVLVGIDPWSLALCFASLTNHYGCYEKVLYYDGGALTGDPIGVRIGGGCSRTRVIIVTTVLHGAATWLPSVVDAAKRAGGELVGIWCIVDNETGGRELAESLYGLKVSSLFTRSQIEADDYLEERHVA